MVDASRALGAGFRVRQDLANLSGGFEARHAASEVLGGELAIRRSASREFPGGFIVRHEASQSLLGGFIARYGFQNLLCGFIVRHSAFVDLKAAFDGQGIESLSAGFISRHSAFLPLELPGQFYVKPSYLVLSGEFEIRRTATLERHGEFAVRHSASDALKCGFDISSPASGSLPGHFRIRYHLGSSSLKAGFTIGDSNALKAGFNVRQLTSDLPCGFEVVTIYPSEDIIREDDFKEWFNVVYGVGTGFLAYPVISDDTVIKVTGLNSGKIVVNQLRGQGYKEIVFGWCWKGLEVPRAAALLKAGIADVHHGAGDGYAPVDPGISVIVDDPIGHGGGYAMAIEPGVMLEIDEPTGHGGVYFDRV
jgi:hypothetical protein